MNINGDNTSDNITNGIITNSSTSGSFIIKCDDNTLYDLQTPNNGNNTDVLTTDGIGNTYWSSGGGGGSTFQDVYNNSLPTPQVVMIDGSEINYFDSVGNILLRFVAPGGPAIVGFVEAPSFDVGTLNSLTSQSNSFIKNNSGPNQYLMADGSITQGAGNPFDQSLNTTDDVIFNSITKQGGTSQQYLMADGSSLQYSANSGNSNFYLYDSAANTTTPPPMLGKVGYNDAIQGFATILYISHRTRDLIDIDVFLEQLSSTQDVYLQDQTDSLNYIRYNITGPTTIIPNSYISIPVSLITGAGTGLTSFGVNHNILVSFFTNSIEVDTRLSLLEAKTFNQTAIPNTTTFIGVQNFKSPLSTPYNQNLKIDHDSLINTISSFAYDETQECTLEISALRTNFNGLVTCNDGLSISNLYTLPNTAPAVGNVLTCSALGISSWITPSPTAYSFLYPFPVISKTVDTAPATRTLACSYTMTTNFTFTKAGVFHPSPGADANRVGIYRGDLSTGVLVGQSLGAVPATDYNVKALTATNGGNLTFTLGEQITVLWTQNGSGTRIATTTGVSNINLALLSSNGYSTTLPLTMTSIAIAGVATTIRMCVDLA